VRKKEEVLARTSGCCRVKDAGMKSEAQAAKKKIE